MTAVGQQVSSGDGVERHLPPGVFVEGPLVDAKLRESYLTFGFVMAGSVGALIWGVTMGIGRVELAVFAGMFALTSVGLGVAMHRLFVHRAFQCGPVMRTIFAALATMVVQGSVLKWVSHHRRHHLYADQPGDPHSPFYDGNGNRHATFLKGMIHAQAGWIWDQATTDGEYYAKDILADPIAMFFTRTRHFWYVMSAMVIPGALGYAFGDVRTMIGCVLFSGLFRTYVMTMATSLTGSICHSNGRYGYRRFDLGDASTNELVTTILTFGEGLHNNHHRFPRDAYISHAWYEFDLNGLIIRGLAKLGLVHDVIDAGKRHLDNADTQPLSATGSN